MSIGIIDPKYAGLPYVTMQATSAFSPGDQMKVGANERTVAQVGPTDAATLSIGVAINSGASGDSCAVSLAGPLVWLTSDGSANINVGDGLTVSSTVAGKIKSSTTNTVARALTAAGLSAQGVLAVWLGGVDSPGTPSTVLLPLTANGTPATITATDTATPLKLVGSMPDGASAVGLRFGPASVYANGSAGIVSFDNPIGTQKSYIDLSGQLRFPVGIGIVNTANTVGVFPGYLGFAAVILGGGGLGPDQQATRPLGGISNKWSQVFAQQYTGTSQTVAFSATPAFNPANGETILNGPVTGNVTGATISNGTGPGQRITVHFLKDATAGAYTIAFAGTNVRAFTSAFTTTASIIVKYSFVWNDQLATAAWVQDAAALVGV